MNYSEILTAKINGYKSYNQRVKDRVLKQLNNVTVTESMYNQAIKALPNVMKSAKAVQVIYGKHYKNVFKLEKHSFAPELNKLHFTRGLVFNVPQKTTIEDALNYLIANKKLQ